MKKTLAIIACLRSRWEKAKAAHTSIPVTPEGNPPMAAVDLSPLAAEFEALSAYLARQLAVSPARSDELERLLYDDARGQIDGKFGQALSNMPPCCR